MEDIAMETIDLALEWLNSNPDKWKRELGEREIKFLIPEEEVPEEVKLYLEYDRQAAEQEDKQLELLFKLGVIEDEL